MARGAVGGLIGGPLYGNWAGGGEYAFELALDNGRGIGADAGGTVMGGGGLNGRLRAGLLLPSDFEISSILTGTSLPLSMLSVLRPGVAAVVAEVVVVVVVAGLADIILSLSRLSFAGTAAPNPNRGTLTGGTGGGATIGAPPAVNLRPPWPLHDCCPAPGPAESGVEGVAG